MRGEFRASWKDFVDHVLGQLLLEWGPPIEWQRDLCFATANAVDQGLEVHDGLMGVIDRKADVLEVLWEFDPDNFRSEADVCALVPAMRDVCGEYDDELADVYVLRTAEFVVRFNLRYSLNERCELRISPAGLVSSLIETVERLGERSQVVQERLADVRDSISDVESDPTSERRIRDAIRYQFILSEELAKSCSATSAKTLGDMCKELDDWPHETFSKTLSTLYGFRNDYPGIGHSGTPSAAKRRLDARDLAATTAILFGFAPYLVDELDGLTGWTPASEAVV